MCINTPYQLTTESVIFQLRDGNGNPVNATTQITISIGIENRTCDNNVFTNTIGLNINPGENTVQYTYDSYDLVDCGPFGCSPETEEYLGVESISGGYELCEIPITPTPTSTSSQEPFNWVCNNGNCTEVFDGSGDYLTQQDCFDNCQQQTFFCKENDFSPCIEQLGPCTGKIDCGPTQS
jgi:hypothetical protein